MTAPEPVAWALVALSYLLGSIPFGLVLGRTVAGVDVRQQGSGNIGATNVARAAGRRLGVLTLLLDAAKGALAVGATAVVLGTPHDSGWAAAAGFAAFLGHVFPPWLRFRGGKGVATGFGVFLVLDPWVALGTTLVFVATVLLVRAVSVASLFASLALVVGTFALHGRTSPVTRVASLVAVVILMRHRSNIRRLLRGEESRVSVRRSGSRSPRPPGG